MKDRMIKLLLGLCSDRAQYAVGQLNLFTAGFTIPVIFMQLKINDYTFAALLLVLLVMNLLNYWNIQRKIGK